MKRLRLVGCLLALGLSTTLAQLAPPTPGDTPSVATASIPLTYTGGDNRVSIGVDKDGHSQGELMGVFANNGEHAIVAQFWWDRGGAGGAQADYNWLWGTTLAQVKDDPDSVTVAKLSFAIDQNAAKDRQANVGFAIERKEFFLNFFLSGNASGSRNAGAITTAQQIIENGTDTVGNYLQTRTDVATTPLQAQAYVYSVGLHGGHFSDALAARFSGGFDYSKGHQGASETRTSIGADKYIGTRGWSISGIAEHSQQNNPIDGNRSDNRWWLFLRYEFGGAGAFSPSGDGGSTAWIQRALRNPVTGHPRTVDTYVTRGKTTTTSTQGPRQYTARRPIAHDDAASVAENSSANAIDVLANDTDPDGNPLSITAVTTPANGSALISGTHVSYTPSTTFVGTDQFDYTVSNTKGLSASAHVTISVTNVAPPPPPPPPPGPPIARNDLATTPFATPVTISVLANDSDPSGYPLTIASVTSPAHGTARTNADGTVVYAPDKTFTGTDNFSYTINNGHGGTAGANVTITVSPPLPPVARDDTASTAFATPVDIYVLDNDTDPNGYLLSVTSTTVPMHGTANVNPGWTITYTPQANFTGVDTFSYSISDGHGGSASANVTVTVQPAHAPVAQPDAAVTPFNKSVVISVLANDTDPNNLPLTVIQVTQPANGSASINANGTITYAPQPTFTGGDSFNYTISNGGSVTASAKVSVTIQPPLAPVAQADAAVTPFRKAVAIPVLANDSDPSGLTLTVTQFTQPAHGSAQLNAGVITYTPASTYFGNDTFSYTVSDTYNSASASVSVTVQAPLPPIARDDKVVTPFQTNPSPITIFVLQNDTDPNGLPLTVSINTQPTFGMVSVNPDGSLAYTPQGEFVGDVVFSYKIDDMYNTATANVTVTVQPPPAATAHPFDVTTCPSNGNDCDICMDTHIDNPSGLSLVLSVSATSRADTKVVVSPSTCTYHVTYTPPDTSNPEQDSFTYSIKDPYNRTSTATVTLDIPAF